MGLFRKKKFNIFCDSCKKKIQDYEFVWINEHKFCQECAVRIQGGAKNEFAQSGNAVQGLNSDSHNYEMIVEDIFFVKNKGTVLCGTVKKGAVRVGDTVYVNGKGYKAIGIECLGTILKEALCGMTIGLLIDCLTPHIFSTGTLVEGEPAKESEGVNTHQSHLEQNSVSKNGESVSYTVEQIDALKKYAIGLLPANPDTPSGFKAALEVISKYIPTVNPLVMESVLKAISAQNNSISDDTAKAYVFVASRTEELLGMTNINKVVQNLETADDTGLLTLWVSLLVFASVLKKEKGPELDKFCSAVFDIIIKRGISLSNSLPDESENEFEISKNKCISLLQKEPNTQGLSELKASLGKMLMEQKAIWVAYDAASKPEYPYVGANGRIEVFTKEEYALNAKAHLDASLNIVKLNKDHIKPFFESMLYMGIMYLNLDSGICVLDISIEDFCPFIGEIYLDRQNRKIRHSLMRYMQMLCRHNKKSEGAINQTDFNREYLNSLFASGVSALTSSIVYALVPGTYKDGITLYTPSALAAFKWQLGKLGICDNKFLISPGDTSFDTVSNITGVETIKKSPQGIYVAVFTDKISANKVRCDLKKQGSVYDYSIVAFEFDELLRFALKCDGVIVDSSTYSCVVEKSEFEKQF